MKSRFLSLLLVGSLFSGCRAEELNAPKNEVIQKLIAEADGLCPDKNSAEYRKFIALIDEYEKELKSPNVDPSSVQRKETKKIKHCVAVDEECLKTYLETSDGEQFARARFSFTKEGAECVAELSDFRVDFALFKSYKNTFQKFFFYSIDCLRERGCKKVKFSDGVCISNEVLWGDVFAKEIDAMLACLRNSIKTHTLFRELGAVDVDGNGEFVYTIPND